jgi:hypothetical protein
MRVEAAPDPRMAPLLLLGRVLGVPGVDTEAQADRKLLHRIDVQEAVRK